MKLVYAVGLMLTTAYAHAAWEYSSNSDPLTDTKVSLARGSGAPHGRARDDVYVIVRCQENVFDVYASMGDFLNTQSLIPVRYRIDKSTPKEETWQAADGKVAFSKNPQDFAAALINGSQLIIEGTDYLGQPHRATFSLVGAAKHIGKVMKDCGVDPATMAKRAAAGPPTDSLSLEFGASSFLRVEDSRGSTLAIGLVQAGEKQVLSGEPPYTVFLGNAKQVRILYRGQVVDFVSHIDPRNDTARFTVP